jgi:hypothetical protein
MTKIARSGSISQRQGSADLNPNPDPHQNVMDPQHWFLQHYYGSNRRSFTISTTAVAKATDITIATRASTLHKPLTDPSRQ